MEGWARLGRLGREGRKQRTPIKEENGRGNSVGEPGEQGEAGGLASGWAWLPRPAPISLIRLQRGAGTYTRRAVIQPAK